MIKRIIGPNKRFFFGFILIIATAAMLFYFVEHSAAVTFPSTPVLDNFNRAGTTAPPSGSWTNGASPATVLNDTCGDQLSGDSATAKNTVTTTNSFCAAMWNASTFGPDTEVYATTGGTTINTANEQISLYTRIDNTNKNWYEVEFDSCSTGCTNNIIIQQEKNNVGNNIGTLGHTVAAGDTFGVKTTGTGATVTNEIWYKASGGSWTSLGTITDSSANRITASGNIGFEMKNMNTGTPANLGTVDDFGGGTVVNNAAPAAPTLSTPSNAATGVSVTPQFTLRTTDADNDYLRYEIQVCSTNNCSSVVRTVCQDSNLPNSCTGSQTGWSGQDQQTSTAYTGNSTITSSTLATYTYQTPALTPNTQYWWRAYAIDPGGTNTSSTASSIQSFTTSQVPVAPSLSLPASGATSVALVPQFSLSTTDPDSDYIDYRLYLYQSDCSTPVGSSPFTELSSQTGWAGQNANSSLAYSSGSTATYTLQFGLSTSTTYCWKADAIDPGGSNTYGSASATQTFTTTSSTSAVQINGGTTINGGSTIQ